MTRLARATVAAAAALTIGAWPSVGHANLEELLGLGPQPMAVGLAATGGAGHFSLAYYNPAGLSALPHAGRPREAPGFVELSFGLMYTRPVLDVDGATPTGTGARSDRDSWGWYLGSRLDLGNAIGLEGLVLGADVYFPGRHIFVFGSAPDEQLQWLNLADQTARVGSNIALSYRITDWLSVGVGIRILFDVVAYTTATILATGMGVDSETGAEVVDLDVRLGEDVSVFGRVAPTLGVQIAPIDRLRIGLTWRGETGIEDFGWTRVEYAPAVGTIGFVHRFAHHLEPHRVALGLSAQPHDRVRLAADLVWSNWSTARTPEAVRLMDGRFGDTWTPAVGIEADVHEHVRVSGGYRFARAAFDNFDGPTNLLDNDRHVVSAGAELRFDDLGVDGAFGMRVRAAGRLAVLVEREETKDFRRFPDDVALETNPGYPGYTHGGLVPSLALEVEGGW